MKPKPQENQTTVREEKPPQNVTRPAIHGDSRKPLRNPNTLVLVQGAFVRR